MLRIAGSRTLGEVRGYDLIRMLSRDGRPTGLGDAFAHYGRILKTLHLHLLQFISDEGYGRLIGAQLNITEARHRIAGRASSGSGASCARTTARACKTSSAPSASPSTPRCCSTPSTSTPPSGTSPPAGSTTPAARRAGLR
jgi:Tn3 transposase DDE domain